MDPQDRFRLPDEPTAEANRCFQAKEWAAAESARKAAESAKKAVKKTAKKASSAVTKS
jgi:hypothetical protein